jgi:Spy/CpxP family protein refolding chaperone
MKRTGWMWTAGIVTLAGLLGATAQEAPPAATENPGPGASRMGMAMGMAGGGAEGIIARLIDSPQLAERLGLTVEQQKKIQDGVFDIRKEIVKLQADLELAGMDQARLMMSNTVSEADVMAAVEKTGKIRTDIAKQNMKQVLMVKQALSPDQIEKLRSLVQERTQRWQRGPGAGPGAAGRDANTGRRRTDRTQRGPNAGNTGGGDRGNKGDADAGALKN